MQTPNQQSLFDAMYQQQRQNTAGGGGGGYGGSGGYGGGGSGGGSYGGSGGYGGGSYSGGSPGYQQQQQGYGNYQQQQQQQQQQHSGYNMGGSGGYSQQQAAPAVIDPLAGASAGSSGQSDYFKGFYEGVMRSGGSQVGGVLSWVAPLMINMAIFVGPLYLMRRRFNSVAEKTTKNGKENMGSAFMDMMNPMKAKNFKVDVKGTKFDDVIGIPEAKAEVKQYVEFLTDAGKFTRLGAKLPKGCLLTGSPGTGKTLLARAIAGEANTPFFACSGADFIEVFGGSGPKRVRELFKEARAAAPCVVFIDEIDAIGSRSGGRSMGGGSSEENRTINQLLAELDGLSSSESIVVLAATNYSEAIDKALLREGRFDRKVNIPMPDLSARSELFEFYLKNVVTGDPVCKPKVLKVKERVKEGEEPAKPATDTATSAEGPEYEDIHVEIVPGVDNKAYAAALADRTPGVSPAQISTIVNEAALTSAVTDEKVVTLKSLQDAIDDVLIGKKHRQRMGESSLRRTAFHESGHCIMAWMSPLQKDVIKLSVIPRGRAGGYTQQVQDEALDPKTDSFLFSQLCVLLGGRCAERIILGDISTGAVDDLQRATKVAMDKLLQFGMSKEIGHLAFRTGEKQEGRGWMTFSENLHSRVEAEARELVMRAYNHTMETLTKNKPLLENLTKLLLEKKELMRPEIEGVLGARPTQ